MKKTYNIPEIRIALFAEDICTEGTTASVPITTNQEAAQNWVQRKLESNGSAISNIIDFTE